MKRYGKWMLGFVVLAVTVAGCATVREGRPATLREAQAPVWSLTATDDEMIVAVSPVRQSVQIIGSSVAVLGAGVDAMVNSKYREAVREALQGYDAGAVFEERLAKRLGEALPRGIERTSALTSTAGLQSKKEANDARYEGIAKRGRDEVLDLTMTYGLFGYEGLLVAKLDGRLLLVPEGRELWDNSIVVSTEPILASDPLADPTKQMGPNLSNPRFTVEEDAIKQWTGDGGKIIRKRFETAVDGAVSALLCDLGLAQEAPGEYYLGKLAMNRKKFVEADTHFKKAIALDPAMLDAENGQAVNLSHNKQVDNAIEIERKLTERAPDYGPAWFNLAWWYSVDKKDAKSAKPYYEKALKLGMPQEKKIEKALGAKQ